MSKPSLLPPNAARGELAMEAAVSRDVPVVVRELWDPAAIPAALLPWLAWGLSVDAWGAGWPDAQKRASVAVSISVHRRKGTPHALRSALGALGYRTRVIEWFQDSPEAAPYTFAIEIEVSAEGITEGVYLQAEVIANAAKNERSHLSRVRAIARTAGAVRVGVACVFGEAVEVRPYHLAEIVARAPVWLAAATAASESTTVFPRNA